jgi:hypothetical protein
MTDGFMMSVLIIPFHLWISLLGISGLPAIFFHPATFRFPTFNVQSSRSSRQSGPECCLPRRNLGNGPLEDDEEDDDEEDGDSSAAGSGIGGSVWANFWARSFRFCFLVFFFLDFLTFGVLQKSFHFSAR